VLGNTGVGKTTLIDRIKGTDVRNIASKKTYEINVEEKRIKLKSSEVSPWYSLEAYRKYRIVAIDNPGDYKHRRQWREAMRRFKTNGMLFILDPEQSVEVQRVAMEASYNYFLDSIDLNPVRADGKAKGTKYIFHFVVNKCDVFQNEDLSQKEFHMRPKVKEHAVDFLSHFAQTMEAFKTTFPRSKFGISYISAIYSPYKDLDKLFELLKIYIYQT
jgi:GTPase SAR1 family protein